MLKGISELYAIIIGSFRVPQWFTDYCFLVCDKYSIYFNKKEAHSVVCV